MSNNDIILAFVIVIAVGKPMLLFYWFGYESKITFVVTITRHQPA